MKAEITTKFSILSLLWGVSFLLLLRVVEAFDWAAAISVRSFIASGSVVLLALIIRRKLDFSIGIKYFAVWFHFGFNATNWIITGSSSNRNRLNSDFSWCNPVVFLSHRSIDEN